MYKKVCCMCRLLVLPRSSIKCINAFFDVFIVVAVVVATALNFDLKGHSLITYGSINPKMYKFVYSETTGCYGNVPVLSRGTFYTYGVSANKNKTFIIKWRHEESWIYLLFEILVRLIYYCFQLQPLLHLEQIAENILFFFCHLKGVRNLHLGGYSIVNLYDFSGVRF